MFDRSASALMSLTAFDTVSITGSTAENDQLRKELTRLGKNADAEANLKQVAGSYHKDVASLAKIALAGLYVQTGKTTQAIDLYKELIAKPTDTVPASAAQLQLAQVYETTDPQQAKQIYAVLKDKDKATAAGQIASQKLNPGAAQQGPMQ